MSLSFVNRIQQTRGIGATGTMDDFGDTTLCDDHQWQSNGDDNDDDDRAGRHVKKHEIYEIEMGPLVGGGRTEKRTIELV